MRKQVKLTNKKPETPPSRRPGIFEQETCAGGTLKAVMVMKGAEMFLVTIFALFLGILAPITIMLGFGADNTSGAGEEALETAAAISADALPANIVWIISSALYIIGFFVLMVGSSKGAAFFHIPAAAGSIVTYSLYGQLSTTDGSVTGPTVLYMPCVFITILTVVIMLVINIPKWSEKKRRADSEKAPSIIDPDE